MKIEKIGYVESQIKKPLHTTQKQNKKDAVKIYNDQVKNNICKIVILDKWQELLCGIEEFSHILVLYWPHLIDEKKREIKKVHPMGRSDIPLKGIFATCSPARPNPILVSAVKLVEKGENYLKVKGFEAVDASPIIDIKPYVKFYYGAEDVKIASWMEKANKEFDVKV